MTESWQDILPKAETQALSFIRKNPEWDGRGIIVGILDTGVCPGVEGLQITSDGNPKIIDVIDCSGSGDVNMTTKKQAVNGFIDCGHGKKIKVNPNWINPSGEFRIGQKKAFELYPGDLKTRVTEKRKNLWVNKLKEVSFFPSLKIC